MLTLPSGLHAEAPSLGVELHFEAAFDSVTIQQLMCVCTWHVHMLLS